MTSIDLTLSDEEELDSMIKIPYKHQPAIQQPSRLVNIGVLYSQLVNPDSNAISLLLSTRLYSLRVKISPLKINPAEYAFNVVFENDVRIGSLSKPVADIFSTFLPFIKVTSILPLHEMKVCSSNLA